MITTRMGSEVERFISKEQDEKGNWWMRVKVKGMDGEREIHAGDFRADSTKEIDDAIESAPVKIKR